MIQETPILAFLGLGLFLWIFLTNSLPAKRDLAHRLGQVELHASEQGRLSILRAELNREDSLAEAVRSDSVVRRALYLHEHPTANSNKPELLMQPMSFEFFPDDPDPIVEEWEFEDSMPPTELPKQHSPAGSGPATENEPTGGRIAVGSNAGRSMPHSTGANLVSASQQPPKTKSTNSRPPAPEGNKRLGTSKPEGRPAPGNAVTRPTSRPATPTAPAPKKPSGPGHFEVPNFLQG